MSRINLYISGGVTWADFFYRPKYAVFIDCLPYKQNYVQPRRQYPLLLTAAYRPLVIRYDDREVRLAELVRHLGVDWEDED